MEMKVRLFKDFGGLGIAVLTLALALPAWAFPPPPVNQDIGMRDVAIGDLTDALCRGCHASGVRNRHDLLDGQPIPSGSVVPYPDSNSDGTADAVYGCYNCHRTDTWVVSGCPGCHSGSNPHHPIPPAVSSDCKVCHGSVVDSVTDGHYIPTYPLSLVTPSASGGDGLPLNSRGNGAGACNYCHDGDYPGTGVILNNHDLHHRLLTGTNCTWCHDSDRGTRMRICEGCHGPTSLHNIQADSPKAGNLGTIVVGGEDAGYGHVGRDAGPADSDCWGCHGFGFAAMAPAASASGPMPVAGSTLYETDCRGCHTSGVPNRHHVLYGQGPIPAGSVVPYPDSDGNGSPDTFYVCLSCHGYNFTAVRDCIVCHSATNPHPECGNGSPESGEQCDDGNTRDGDCCSATCRFEAAGSSCADGAFCNGAETCDGAGTCQAGTPVDCSDGIACTSDVCDETTRACVHTADSGRCTDGLFCNGQEICDPVQGCVSTSPVDCTDGVACTSDACDEANDRCVHQPDNTKCPSDGLFCTGQEICDSVRGCVSTGNPCLSGTICYEAADACLPTTGKVTICHIPPGNPGKAKTLSVDAGSAVDHLVHGDTFGPCPK